MSTVDRFRRAYDHLIERWVALSFRRPLLVLLPFAVITALLVPVATSMRIDTDMKRLLPHSYATVRELDRAIAKVGDLGYFSVVVENDDQQESLRFAAALAERLRRSPLVRTVTYENPVDFLETYRFQLVPVERLEAVRDEIKQGRRKASPFNLSLEGAAQPSDGKEEIERVKDAYRSLARMQRYHLSSDGRVLAMQVRPRDAVTNTTFVRGLYDFLVAEAEAVKAQGFSSDLEVHVAGSLRNKLDEYNRILGDVMQSAWMSGLLIIGVMLAYFRSLRRIGVLLAPLAAGLVWAFALAYVTIGFLNTISAMLFIILFGLGIDHGTHLLRRYVQVREKDNSQQHAIAKSLRITGRAVWLSTMTTATGFLLMVFSDFRGFSHLGIIAGSAMLLMTSGYFATLPALIALTDRRGALTREVLHGLGARFWRLWARKVTALPGRAAAILALVLLAAGAVAAWQLEFNYDFDALRGTSADSRRANSLQSTVYKESLTPGAVVFARDDAALDAVLRALAERKAADTTSPTIGRVVSIRDFVPADMAERLRLLAEIKGELTPLTLASVEDEELRDILEELKAAADVPPVTRADVPATILDYFTPQDGSRDHMVFIYPSVERRQGKNAIAFADDMKPFTVDGTTYVPTSDSLVFADILRVAVSHGTMIFTASLLLIMVLLMWQFQGLRGALAPALSLFSGLGMMAIGMHVFGLDVNLYNMVIFASVVGMGVDASIHVTASFREHSGRSAIEALEGIGGANTINTFTTVAGYFGMAFSDHPGLRSIGQLSILGLTTCWIVAMTLLPAYLAWRDRLRTQTPAAELARRTA